MMAAPILALSQISKLEGIILDADSKNRVGEVMIYNPKTGVRQFNNHRGEFTINALPQDTLIFSKEGFFSDTLAFVDRKVKVISMKRDFTYIEPVRVIARKSPDQLLEEAKREYKDAYRLADPGDFLSTGLNGMGAGLSINAIYNLFSKEGKNARRFTEYMNTLYRENVIDSKFTPDLVRNLVGLEGDRLKNFMIRYRPTYEFVTQASHYELTQYIKSKYSMFKLVPDLRPLPELPKIELDVITEQK